MSGFSNGFIYYKRFYPGPVAITGGDEMQLEGIFWYI